MALGKGKIGGALYKDNIKMFFLGGEIFRELHEIHCKIFF